MIKCLSVLLLLVAACSADGNETTVCGQKEVSLSYLDVALNLITKAKNNFPEYNCESELKAMDCGDILRLGQNKSGVYKIYPVNRVSEGKSLEVYCDMVTSGGGWTVIQRRGEYQRAQDYFFKDWKSYKEGFGDIEKDFWLGNDNIFALTNQKLFSVRFDLQDVDHRKKFAVYDTFWIDDENQKYTLHISDYSGDAGDSMIDHHDNQKFSTKDRENDNQRTQHCAQKYKGGWWYNTCHHANLNGLFKKGKHEYDADGMSWLSWKGYYESMLTTEIKIRPKNFKLSSVSPKTP